MKTARDHARSNGRIKEGAQPQIIIPWSDHPAFDKAARILGLEIIRVPTGEYHLADVPAMEEAINENTIALVGFAPSFPFGTIDPIQEIAKLAEKHDLWRPCGRMCGRLPGTVRTNERRRHWTI